MTKALPAVCQESPEISAAFTCNAADRRAAAAAPSTSRRIVHHDTPPRGSCQTCPADACVGSGIRQGGHGAEASQGKGLRPPPSAGSWVSRPGFPHN